MHSVLLLYTGLLSSSSSPSGELVCVERFRICFFILLLMACHPRLSCTPSTIPPPRHVSTFQLQRAKEEALRSYDAHDVAT